MQHRFEMNPSQKQIGPPLLPGETRLYTRKSVKNESSSKSLEDQADENLETCEEWGIPASKDDVREEKPGHGGDEWWQGGGVSGLARNGNDPARRSRPVLTDIVREIEAGAVRCVVVWSQDRLWRDVGLCDALINLFASYGVRLYDRNGVVDISTPDGKAKVRNTAIAAQHYREMCAVNSPRGIRRSAKKGGNVNNANMLGYRGGKRGECLVFPQPEELDMVRRIFRLYDAGEVCTDGTHTGPLSMEKIANLLHDEGFLWTPDLHKTRGVQRNEHTRDIIYDWQVKHTLTDPRYNGRQRYGGDEYECPAYLVNGQPVIDDALWNRVQDKINSLRRVGSKGQQSHALVGLMRCGVCGQAMHPYNSHSRLKSGETKSHRYWRNVRYEQWCWCKDDLPYVRVSVVDEYLEQIIAPLLVAELEDRATSAQRNQARDQEARLTRALRKAERKYREELPGYISQVTPQMLGQMEQKLLTEIGDLKVRLRTAEREARDDLDGTKASSLASLADAPDAARRDAIRSVLRWVAVIPSGAEREPVPGYSPKTRKRPATFPGWFVFCTSWGTLHTARIRRMDTGETDHRQLRLEEAPVEDVFGTVADFPDPEAFAQGIERSWKCRKYEYAPDEVLPGYTLGTRLPLVAEFDVDDLDGGDDGETVIGT